ncbi:CgeB family protein [Arenibaculum sp.]|jgi:spore maturation protein CgeB|uniref:CgeB family protein n=1 Tax=Arenibaculum sp. TaxID=2865862 RepID=UPI002E12F65F|nr:glycosyltransferase [Arenibaculum sp.]
MTDLVLEAKARIKLDIVFLGLSITSSWGNGHATTYRALVKALARRGHRVTFLECDKPWYAENRDLPDPPWCRLGLYGDLDDLASRYGALVAKADLVVVGSFVPDGVNVGAWAIETARGLVAFYDIDTPVTLAKLVRGDTEYLTPALISEYDLYLSFTGGPTLDRLESEYGAAMARALYCSVDPDDYFPGTAPETLDLGYLGTYSPDRQPKIDRLLIEPARAWPEGRFTVAGPQYPAGIEWPANVARIDHLAPGEHRRFYNAQRFTLNVTRADMVAAGWSPSVRLFEAAACGTPILSDWWEGLDAVFEPGREILVVDGTEDVLRHLRDLGEEDRQALANAARARVLKGHTAAHRAAELEAYAAEAFATTRRPASTA